MLASMTSRQVSEWMAYFSVEHLGEYAEYRSDLRAGIVAASVLNSQPGRKTAVKPTDVMPQFETPSMTPQDLHARMMSLAEKRSGVASDVSPKQAPGPARDRQ